MNAGLQYFLDTHQDVGDVFCGIKSLVRGGCQGCCAKHL